MPSLPARLTDALQALQRVHRWVGPPLRLLLQVHWQRECDNVQAIPAGLHSEHMLLHTSSNDGSLVLIIEA